MKRKASYLWLLAYAVAALALAFVSAGGVLLVLYPDTGIDVNLLLWRGVVLFGTFLPLSLIANTFYHAEQPKGIYSWEEALSFCRMWAVLLLGFGLLFLKVVTDVGICYIALGLVLVYISTRLKSKKCRSPLPLRSP